LAASLALTWCGVTAGAARPDLFELEAGLVAAAEWTSSQREEAWSASVEVLLDAEQPDEVRLAAARILDRAGPGWANARARLWDGLAGLEGEKRWRISSVVVAAVEQEPELRSRLEAWATGHDDPALRYFAVRVLAATGAPAVDWGGRLREIWSHDPEPQVRWAALRALEPNAGEEDGTLELLVSLLDVDDADLRRLAARGLEQAGPRAEAVIPHLIGSLSAEDGEEHVRAQLWRTLLAVGPEDTRVVGPETRRVSRAGPAETQPGLSQRLPESFQSWAVGAGRPPDGVGEGYRYYSGTGWRGGGRALPAFPGAQGFGMWTPGGRGGQVLRVTNLADSGPGSLREAVGARGPRIVIFDVSGIIHLQSPIQMGSPYLTLAGQTAPGDGIVVSGGHTQIGTNDVIVRHLRFRPGDTAPHSAKGINVREGDNIILDQISTSWAKEETFSVVHSGRVTVQRSFITHGLVDAGHPKGARGYGSLIRGAGPDNHDYAQGSYYSFINNLWAHQASRAPRPGNYRNHELDPVGPLFDFRNNVFYNWGGRNSGDNFDRDTVARYNFVNNYYQAGPNTGGEFALNDVAPYSKAHWSGNSMNGEVRADPWSLVSGRTDETYRQREPFRAGQVRTESAAEAYERVLAYAGAWPRDPYDRQVVEEVRTRTGGMIDSDKEVGGLPHLRPALPPTDTNGNGIPDWWQIRHGIAPGAPLDAAGDMNGSGYTNIEEYLNGMALDRSGPAE
jgi:hypothetical protein